MSPERIRADPGIVRRVPGRSGWCELDIVVERFDAKHAASDLDCAHFHLRCRYRAGQQYPALVHGRGDAIFQARVDSGKSGFNIGFDLQVGNRTTDAALLRGGITAACYPASPPTSNAPAHPPSASGSVSMAKHNPSFSPTMIPRASCWSILGAFAVPAKKAGRKRPSVLHLRQSR